MDLLNLIGNHGTYKRAASTKGGEYAGPCPWCGGNDRFRVWPKADGFWCRGCDKKGDSVTYLREIQGLKCPDAYDQAGKRCDATDCPADRCRLHPCRVTGSPSRRHDQHASVEAPREKQQAWQPSAADDPAEAWQRKAGKLVAWAHEQLLEDAEQLAYLAGRGIDRAAVEASRLGYIPQDIFRDRAAWGLPYEKSERTGRAKKLWIPQGIVIPLFTGEHLHRVRIRRQHVEGDSPRYYWLPGSGNDVMVLEPEARAFVVVEAELDAIACAAAGEGKVGAVPLGTVSAKPRSAHAILEAADVILVALDADAAGGRSFGWWAETYRQAVRWPVPAGKDPGDYVKDHGGDLRAWLQAGLQKHCPVLALEEKKQSPVEQKPGPAPQPLAEAYRGVSRSGREYWVAPANQAQQVQEEHPEIPVYTVGEIKRMKGLHPDLAEPIMDVKSIFPGAVVLGVR